MTDIYGDELRRRWEMTIRQMTETLPDGKYVALLRDARVIVSKAGNPMIAWEWEVSTGEFAGYSLRDYDGLSGEKSPEMVVRKLITMGIDPPRSLDDLEDTLADLVAMGRQYSILIRTSGDFTRVRVLGRVGASPSLERQQGTLPLETPPSSEELSLVPSREVPPVDTSLPEDTIEDDPFADMPTVEERASPSYDDLLIPGVTVRLKGGVLGQVVVLDGDRVSCRIQGKLRTVNRSDIEAVVTGGDLP